MAKSRFMLRSMPGPAQRRRRARGQTLVEFALALPVLLMLTLGALDAARVFAAQVAINNAVREAALFASRGTNYLIWCRNPSDPAAADPSMPVSVTCPTGAIATNYANDPANIAYRVAAETWGLDTPRITLAPPACGPGPATPTSTCAAGGTKPKYVLISARYSMDLVTPLLSNLWGSPVNITATALARADP